MSRSGGMFWLHASIAVVVALVLATQLRAETIRVHKIVKPTVAETSSVTDQHADRFSCYPFTCPDPFYDALFEASDIPTLSVAPAGRIVVGFQSAFDPGTGP